MQTPLSLRHCGMKWQMRSDALHIKKCLLNALALIALNVGKVVYDYYGMIESLMKNEGMSDEDASDFISYNTIRFAPYLKDRAPLVVDQSYATDLDGLKENCEQEVRYPEAVLGLDLVQTKVVYDYDKLLGVVEKENDWNEDTARDYIISHTLPN